MSGASEFGRRYALQFNLGTLTVTQFMIVRMAVQYTERIFEGAVLSGDERRWGRTCLESLLHWARPTEPLDARFVMAARFLQVPFSDGANLRGGGLDIGGVP